jgi:hypothetical protein
MTSSAQEGCPSTSVFENEYWAKEERLVQQLLTGGVDKLSFSMAHVAWSTSDIRTKACKDATRQSEVLSSFSISHLG